MTSWNLLNVGIVVPIYNGGQTLVEFCQSLQNSVLKASTKYNIKVLFVDSSSTDNSVFIIKSFFKDSFISIKKSDFNHGGTRNYGLNQFLSADFGIYLTQDAILNDCDAIVNILEPFNDNTVGAVYGRQIPHYDANPLAIHARIFNYGENDYKRGVNDVEEFGLKTVFMSNSFAAYRCKYFWEVGGFPSDTILSEDMYMASKLLLKGYSIAYSSKAVVRHSHNYSPAEEFKRYFDIGVFHACEPWIRAKFGGAGGEGIRYVRSELNYLCKKKPLWMLRSLITCACKLLGYKLGLKFRLLPVKVRPFLSMYKGYWAIKK